MVGDTVISEGVEFEVVWAGGEGLTADRETLPPPTMTIKPEKRIYTKTGKHVGEFNKWHKKPKKAEIDAVFDQLEKGVANVSTEDC